MQGFIVNDAAVTTIGTSYALAKKILLHEDSSADSKSRAMPQACYLSHLELQLDETSSTVANISAYITWDDTGDSSMTAEAKTQTVHAGLTDTSLRLVAIQLDAWVTAPSTQTAAGKCYLFLKCDAGAVTCNKARLYWAIR